MEQMGQETCDGCHDGTLLCVYPGWGVLQGLLVLCLYKITHWYCCPGDQPTNYFQFSMHFLIKGLFILGFSLSVEIVGCKEKVPFVNWVSYKNLIANFIHIPYALGQAVLTLMAYFFNQWR